jgi:hypothetical protein
LRTATEDDDAPGPLTPTKQRQKATDRTLTVDQTATKSAGPNLERRPNSDKKRRTVRTFDAAKPRTQTSSFRRLRLTFPRRAVKKRAQRRDALATVAPFRTSVLLSLLLLPFSLRLVFKQYFIFAAKPKNI